MCEFQLNVLQLKIYPLLNNVLPFSVAPVTDQIFTVCYYLNNDLPYVVPPPEEKLIIILCFIYFLT